MTYLKVTWHDDQNNNKKRLNFVDFKLWLTRWIKIKNRNEITRYGLSNFGTI